MMKRALLAAAFFASLPLHASTNGSRPSIADALQEGSRQHRPVLIDFHAVWCYSCYYMATHVTTGPAWEAVERKAIVVDADADSPEGHEWMQKLKITFLPSYVVLDEHGQELGRILAEQPQEKFFPRINAILASGSTLDSLKASAGQGSADAVASVLDAYQARGEGKEGLTWYATLPPAARKSAAANDKVALGLERLELVKAQQSGDIAAVVVSAQKVLAAHIGCDRPYVLDNLLSASKKLPIAKQRALLAAQRKPLDDYLTNDIFVATPACADQRSAVLASADLNAALGDHAAEQSVLDRAIAWDRQLLGDRPAKDRNLADVLRVYLARAGRTAELDRYLRQLIDAYPDDYVYAYRYGLRLLEANQPDQALPWLAKAADKAYGVNRLTVATARVKALTALHRQAEARQVVAEALKQNGPWFPKQAALLKASVS